MSHFAVLVVTDAPDDVEAALQPYHEYECTGNDDEFVVDVDNTEEVEKWLTDELYVGIHKEKNEPNYYYHEKDAKEKLKTYELITRRDYFTLKYKHDHGDDVSQYDISSYIISEASDWFGCTLKDGKWIRHTNPNAKWDWWEIGGRWSGLLWPKKGVVGMKGEPGIMGSQRNKNGIDQCLKSEVDFETPMFQASTKAEKEYTKAQSIIELRTMVSWEEARNTYDDISAARDFYHSQPVKKDLQDEFGVWAEVEEYFLPREKFVRMRSINAISTFAVLYNGNWLERGDMGWFGMCSNEKDRAVWHNEYLDILKDIPDDKYLTVVDCHI